MKIKCWFCGRNLMEEAPDLGKGWFRCECGATWIDTAHLGQGKEIYKGHPWGGKYAISLAQAKEKGYV